MILPRDSIATLSSSAALYSLIPDFFHYIIAFFVLAAFWMGHHEQFSKIHHLDKNFLLLNVIALFVVTLLPFSTSFIGDYSGDVIATCLFEANLMVLGLIFTAQWYYATRNHRLVSPELSEYQILRRLAHGLTLPAISLIGSIITVMGFDSSTMIYMTSPLAAWIVNHYLQKKKPESEP
jgi:uncharacterized membrane protein